MLESETLSEECPSHVSDQHDHSYAGAVGMKSTAKLLSNINWWPSRLQSMQNYVRSCEPCQRYKPVTIRKARML